MAETFQWLDPYEYDDMARLEALRNAAAANGGNVVLTSQTCKSYVMGTDKHYPTSVDLLDLFKNYMGSPSGVWDANAAPDQQHLNSRPLYDISHSDVSQDVINKRNELGAIYLLNSDPFNVFYPTFSNTNSDAELPDLFLGFVCSTIVHINHSNWKRRVGSSLTDQQYVERSVEYLNREISKRFDNRYAYQVDSSLTPADKKRRYSWSTNVMISTPGIKTVNKLKLTVSSQAA